MSTGPANRENGLSDDSEPVYELAGLTEGGLAIREGAPDGPIFVLDPEDAAALCGCGPGTWGVGEFIEHTSGEVAQ